MNTKHVASFILLVTFGIVVFTLMLSDEKSENERAILLEETDMEQPTQLQREPTDKNMPPPPFVEKAREDLARKLGVSAKNITTLDVKEETWPDACLGLGGPDEICTKVQVPGVKVTLNVDRNRNIYIYRTDMLGTMLRLETTSL